MSDQETHIEPEPAAVAQYRRGVRLCIVCPMANEEADCVRFVTQMLLRAEGFREVRFLAILDNVSTDKTLDLLRGLAAREPRLAVVWAPENRGIVDAYLRAYREGLATGFEWVLEIDAGFSHRPDDLPGFFAPMSQGYDIVFGSRFAPGGRITHSSFSRRLVSQGGTFLTNLLLGTTLRDMTSGYQMFRHDALRTIMNRGIKSRGHFFQTEMKVYARNMRVTEVPIHYSAASKRMNMKSIRDAIGRLFALFVTR